MITFGILPSNIIDELCTNKIINVLNDEELFWKIDTGMRKNIKYGKALIKFHTEYLINHLNELIELQIGNNNEK